MLAKAQGYLKIGEFPECLDANLLTLYLVGTEHGVLGRADKARMDDAGDGHLTPTLTPRDAMLVE